MKVTLIIAVRNEEKSILKLLDCIKRQSKVPDEVIISDGGSIDRTVEIIEENKQELCLKILNIGPALPGKGRNRAVAESNHEIVAIADAGVEFGVDWLKSLIDPFVRDEKIDVVFGGYRPLCKNSFMKATALFVASDKDPQYGFRFPAMPSMAIRKSVYLEHGGCPEDLRAAEDSIFFRRLFESKVSFAVARTAVIDWEMEDSWTYLIRKNFQAAKFEILGGYVRKRSVILFLLYPFFATIIVSSVFWTPELILLLVACFSFRVTGSKRMDPELYRSLMSSMSGILWLSLVTLVADMSHLAGNVLGLCKYLNTVNRPKLHLWRGARFQVADSISGSLGPM